MKLIFFGPVLVFLAQAYSFAQPVEPKPEIQQTIPVQEPSQGSVVNPIPEDLAQGGEGANAIPVAVPEGESKPPVIPILPDDNSVYNASESRRDPFRPFGAKLVSASPVVEVPASILEAAIVDAPKGPPPRSLEPLEYFEVDKIEVLALIWGVKKPRALVKDPQGGIHTIWLGQRIGPNQGKVIGIREGELEVLEYFDQQGKTIEVPRTIALKKPVGGK